MKTVQKNMSVNKCVVDLKNVAIYHTDGESRSPKSDDELVLSDVNLSVAEGEMVYFIGRVGSGKSTLLKTLYAEVQLLEGEGRVRLQLTTSEFTMNKMIDFSKEAEMPVFMKGDVFHVNIFLDKNSALYALTAEMETLEG